MNVECLIYELAGEEMTVPDTFAVAVVAVGVVDVNVVVAVL